jgi:type IV pilus assembly protein PilW
MKTSRGFSLVEMMVALVIGLFVSLAAISTAKQFALVTGKASSANANQNNVLSSIVAIESAIGQAGLGLYNNGSSTCGYLDVAYANAVAVNKAPVIAARIARGGASDTYTGDMITIVYAETASATSILKSGTNQTTINTSAQVQSNGAVAANDFVLLSELNAAATCILRQVTAAAAAVDTNGKPVTNLLFGASAYNATGFSGEAAKTGYSVIPIGTKMIVYESWYAHKATNTLRKINLITGAESIIADGVIALRAQYGAMGASSLDQWIGTDDAAWDGIWDVLDPADSTDANRIKKIRAIRFSVLTRESFLQKVDSASCNSTTNPVVPMGWGASSVDISDIHNWRCYTYRVATRVVPLRNAIWGLGS